MMRCGLSCTHVLTARQQLAHVFQPAAGRHGKRDQSLMRYAALSIRLRPNVFFWYTYTSCIKFLVHIYLVHVFLIKHRAPCPPKIPV